MTLSITYILMGITAFVSYLAFGNRQLMDQLQFNAAKIIHRKEYHRLVTHVFVHGGWSHLFVNMFVLFFFGSATEQYFSYFFGRMGSAYFLILYFGGALFSNLLALIKHRNNSLYNAVGASGAVAAVLFAFIFINPWENVYFFGILPIPGILFAILYLLYSYRMNQREQDHIAHDAHLLGATFGILFPIILRPSLLQRFINELLSIL